MYLNIKFFTVQQAGRDCLMKQIERDEMEIEIPMPPVPKVEKKTVKWSKTAKEAFKYQLKGLIP